MQKFERIVQEALVMGGQARIRDTGITVNEIVCLSLEGKSQAEILVQFPDLEAEDVHQALAHAMNEATQAIQNNQFKVLEAITPILAFSEFLVDGHPMFQNSSSSEVEEFKSKLPEIIILNGKRAKSYTKALSTWQRINFSPMLDAHLEPLGQIIEEVIKHTKEFNPHLEIEISLRVESSRILLNSNFFYVLTYLFAGIEDVTPKINCIIEESDNSLGIKIARELFEHSSKHSGDYTGSLLQIAQTFLYRMGSELKIQQEETHVIFEFALPIVEES